MGREDLVDVTVDKILRQTEKAFLVEVEGEEKWVAKSQVENANEIELELDGPESRRSIDTIEIPRWLAVQNGWADEE